MWCGYNYILYIISCFVLQVRCQCVDWCDRRGGWGCLPLGRRGGGPRMDQLVLQPVHWAARAQRRGLNKRRHGQGRFRLGMGWCDSHFKQKLPLSEWTRWVTYENTLFKVAVNSHLRWVFFDDCSINSWSISLKFCKHCWQVFRRLPWNLSKYFKSYTIWHVVEFRDWSWIKTMGL